MGDCDVSISTHIMFSRLPHPSNPIPSNHTYYTCSTAKPPQAIATYIPPAPRFTKILRELPCVGQADARQGFLADGFGISLFCFWWFWSLSQNQAKVLLGPSRSPDFIRVA